MVQNLYHWYSSKAQLKSQIPKIQIQIQNSNFSFIFDFHLHKAGQAHDYSHHQRGYNVDQSPEEMSGSWNFGSNTKMWKEKELSDKKSM